MKWAANYDVVMPVSQVAAFQTAHKRERKALLRFFDRLAADPFMTTDWIVRDENSRDNYQIQVGAHLLTYWSDHAAKEVRITRLERIE